MRLTAANGIKVVLNGQGADETLAGYPTYFRDYWNSLLRAGHLREGWSEMAGYRQAHGGSTFALFARQCKHFLQGSLASHGTYRRAAAWSRRRQLVADDWFSPALQTDVPTAQSEVEPTDLDSSLINSIGIQPLPLYLRLEDRNSMAHSVEARVPFLDHRLVEFAFALPPNWRMRGPWNKYLLRSSMQNRIPESVRTRAEKFGFPVPVRDWMSNALYEPARDLIAGRASRERGIYNVDRILADLERHRKGEIDVGYKVFNVLQFETWSTMVKEPSAAGPLPAKPPSA
jgi:asparagine synthase (glutamine-hydrolysing)